MILACFVASAQTLAQPAQDTITDTEFGTLEPESLAQAKEYWDRGMLLPWPGYEQSTIALEGPLGGVGETVIGVSIDGEPIPFRLADLTIASDQALGLQPAVDDDSAPSVSVGVAEGWVGVNEAPGLVWYISETANGITQYRIQPIASLDPDEVQRALEIWMISQTGIPIGLPLLNDDDSPHSRPSPPVIKPAVSVWLISIGIHYGKLGIKVWRCKRLMRQTFDQELLECEYINSTGDTLCASYCTSCALDAYIHSLTNCNADPDSKNTWASFIEGCSACGGI